MSTPLQTLKRYGITPKRSRGQNFLIDENIVRKIIAESDIQSSDTIVEVGSGSGILTQQLAQKANTVYAVEIDKQLIPILFDLKKQYPNIEIIQQDIRAVPTTTFTKSEEADFSYRVIANIPYNITSLLIRKFLEEKPRPNDMILMVQLEVAQRICAKSPHMNLLAAMTQYYGKPDVLFKVSRSCFYPKPNVDSAVIRIQLDQKRDPDADEARRYTQCVKAGFSAPRKLLASNLSKGLQIPREHIIEPLTVCGISPKARAQELSVRDWIGLSILI